MPAEEKPVIKETLRCPRCDSLDIVRVPKNGWERFRELFGELRALACKACLHRFVKPLE